MAANGVGHKMWRGQVLARQRICAHQGARPRADLSISGPFACAPLSGATNAVAEELAAIERGLAWAWFER